MGDRLPPMGSIFEGRFEILAPLGEGGFGRVYKARQLSTGQAVAIKVLRFWEGDAPASVENQIARFRREMRLCAELSHPNIVRLIDSGESGDGFLYAVFEYVPGSTLREILVTDGSLGWEVARHLMAQVLDALACAHAHGVVHRDLKPENIMVTRTGAQRNALVLDFGLGGLALEVQDWSLPRLTATQELLGTPGYAAPEQLRGEPPSRRSDLYSWGLIFLECLTGEPLMSGSSLQEVILKQLGPEPVPIPPVIRNGHLRRLLQRVTAKQVERRDLTIDAILQTLSILNAEELQPPRGFNAADAMVAATPSAAEGERRHLTVLFCDLVGSTELSARLDPEDFRDVVRAYQRSAEAVVARFGGHVGKYLGDGLLVYFGWPKAHEDDAERAARAGLGLLDTITALNERLAPGVRLAVRVGMHTGPVVIDEDVFGETPNVAARVQQLAAPGTVVITAATHALVKGLFVVEERGPHPLRGLPEPMVLYQVVTPSGVRSRLAAAAAVRGLTAFVGREEERRLLGQRFAQAREGEGQVVLLVGEPGIGKSRLAQVMHQDLAGMPHRWLESGGSPYFANTPFYAVTDLFKQFLCRDAKDPAESRLSALERALETAGLRPLEALPLVAPLLDLPVPKSYPPVLAAPEVARKRLLATLAAWVFGVARLQLMIVLLEDLQWVDPSTLELQHLLVEQGATVPLVLLYTARPEFLPPWSPRAHHTQLTLNRLQRKYARELVTHVAAGKALPAEVIEAVVARTDGVPLFAEELTKAVIEADGGEATRARMIPATLQGSLMARLDRLGGAKEVAQLGAVIGREFSYALLHVVSPLPEAGLQAALARLIDAELLYPRGLPPEATYVFKHALVQDVAYTSLLKSRRRELHRAIAQVLAERFPGQAEAEPELLARHCEAAGLIDEAATHYERAGELAQERSAHEVAITHFRKAIALVGTQPGSPEASSRELELLTKLGPALMATKGVVSETQQVYARARELCEQVGTTPARFTVLWNSWLIQSMITRSDMRDVLETAERVLALAEDANDPSMLIEADHAMWFTLLGLGAFDSARKHAERALGLYDSAEHHKLTFLYGGHDPSVCARSISSVLLWHLGFPDRAVKMSAASIREAEGINHPFSLGLACLFAARLRLMRGEAALALPLAARGIAVATENGFPNWLAVCLVLQARAALSGDAVAPGPERLLEVWGRNHASVPGSWRPYCMSVLADALVNMGSYDQGSDILTEGFELIRDTNLRECEAELKRVRGEMLWISGRSSLGEAEKCLREAIALATEQCARSWQLRATTSLARLLTKQNRGDEARAILAETYAWFTEGFDTADLKEAKALLDQLQGRST